MAGLLERARIVAQPGFNRWLVPPAALAIHLSIGQAYAFSVFKLPLTKVLGITASAPGDWSQSELAWCFTLAIVFLGLSAAVFGRWLEHAGPRKSGVVAAICWSCGFFISAIGVRTHQIWLLYLGYGVLGGCGLGLGYITPVSTLIKWFPDRRGMATGMAIMGFGGGALIASPLSQILLDRYKSASSVGVAETFVTLGCLYLAAMLAGAFLFRVPAPDWKPAGWTPPAANTAALITRRHVHVDQAIRTAPFYFLWTVLFLNVTAGIGILEQASPMIQEMFKGVVKASAAAGFVGLLSLFNMGGRFGWSSLSDRLGRKVTYGVFFTLGPVLYILLPYAGRIGSVALFVTCAALIITMYGGGFATIPAYLSDLFGTQYVGAIHGRLLTAWSAAGVAGPVLVNYIREYQIARGVPPAQAYNLTMYLMAGLLVLGFVANLAVRPVEERFYMSDAELARERGLRSAPGHA
ncbi:MAG TPA: OFA family MFS transporter [Gemmatimonadales bacterium]|jgi:MFS family permease|nr:OFA family MFS transporter [Gemmatimonadales bacterium]